MARLTAVLSATGLFALLGVTSAFAAGMGQPEPWQLGWQQPVTDIAERIQHQSFNLHVLAAVITLFVTALLVYVCVKFSAKNNPTPSRFTHNTLVEVVWTVVPVVILVAMAYPSIKLLYYQETIPESEVTIKATGYQWYWGYTYEVDGEEYIYDAYMSGKGYANYDAMVAGMKEEGASDEEIPSAMEWKLKATAPMVVPVNTKVRLHVAAADVMHAWTVPSFGVKVDAIPGRLNELWFEANTVGTFYGQCSELCGKDHSYMPIMVEVVPKEDYEARLGAVLEEYAGYRPDSGVKVAAAVE